MPCPFKVVNCDLILSTNKLSSTSLTWTPNLEYQVDTCNLSLLCFVSLRSQFVTSNCLSATYSPSSLFLGLNSLFGLNSPLPPGRRSLSNGFRFRSPSLRNSLGLNSPLGLSSFEPNSRGLLSLGLNSLGLSSLDLNSPGLRDSLGLNSLGSLDLKPDSSF